MHIKKYLERNFRIKVVPTYRCNISCSYCYTQNFQKDFKDMSWETFEKVVAQLIREKGVGMQIMGGEPTVWPHIDDAIMLLKEKSLISHLLTNGIRTSSVPPTEVHLNIEHFFEGKHTAKILKTLEDYRAMHALIRFRYNLQPSDSQEKMYSIISLAKDFGIPTIHVGLAWPHPHSREFGTRAHQLCKHIRDAGIQCAMADPLPLCLFGKEELDYLLDNTNLIGICHCGVVPLINPDGCTIFPCQAVPIPRPMVEPGSFRNVAKLFEEELERIRNDMPAKCRNCRDFLETNCQNGCLGNRFSLEGPGEGSS